MGDISNLNQFEDEYFDHVYARHVLEHIPQNQVLGTLVGMRRILRPGGQLMVPDPDTLCHLFPSPWALIDVKWHVLRMMFGGRLVHMTFTMLGLSSRSCSTS